MTTSLAPPRSAAAMPERLAWTGFELDGRVFAFPYLSVERVVPATPVTALPFAPAGVEGVASISGDIIPVLALPVLLGADGAQPAQAGAQFLVIRVSGRRFALRADRVLFVANPLAEEGMAEWRGRPVTCLAVERLGLANLKPFLPPEGAPGLVADSRATVVHDAATPSETVLMVDAAGSSYGLPASSIVELLEDATITRLPLAPPFLTGVAILRRQPVLAFSLARLLGGEPTAATGGHVVMAIGRSRFVLAVDAMGGLQRVSATAAEQSPAGAHPIRLDPAALITPQWLALAAEMSGTISPPAVVASDRQRFLCVSLGDRSCAVPLAAVERILPPRAPIRLPAGAPPGIDGAIEFGGRIIPVTEGWRWLSVREGGAVAALIVLQQDGERRVLAVNALQRIVTIAADDILPTGDHDPRIAGLGKAAGRSLEILSTSALMARGDAA
jgi:purine-binding chemotaxis protein CheW